MTPPSRDDHQAVTDSASDPEGAPSILNKAVLLLSAFTAQDRVLTLSELTRASGLPKSTVHRLLAKLLELDVVEQQPTGYKIGLRLIQLSANTPAGVMRDSAVPHMASLQRWSGRTVGLFVLRGFDVVLLERLGTTADDWPVGTRRPALATAPGRALLSHEDVAELQGSLEALTEDKKAVLGNERVADVMKDLRKIRHDGIARVTGTDRDHWLATPLVVSNVAVGALGVGWTGEPATDSRLETALRSVAVQLANDLRENKRRNERLFPRGEPKSSS